ncbi:MAG: hypothetical protein QF386_01380, partial [Alphaproteobacteria bacterium]|nr:hypothetical protein [Alphaproteobacteria bacterium]
MLKNISIRKKNWGSILHADYPRQGVNIPRRFTHFIPVSHEGNTQGSEEEVEVITRLAKNLIGAPYWPATAGGVKRTISWSDILFVAPYNYQVNLLRAALGTD